MLLLAQAGMAIAEQFHPQHIPYAVTCRGPSVKSSVVTILSRNMIVFYGDVVEDCASGCYDLNLNSSGEKEQQQCVLWETLAQFGYNLVCPPQERYT